MRIFELFRLSASDELIEGEIILTDLVDINLTEAEVTETARYDALSMAAKAPDDDKPQGKRVY